MANQELIAQFVVISGAPADTARQFLEQANGDLAEAIEAFYASSELAADEPQPGPSAAPAPEPATRSRPQPARRSEVTSRTAGQSNVRGLGDMVGDDDWAAR